MTRTAHGAAKNKMMPLQKMAVPWSHPGLPIERNPGEKSHETKPNSFG